MFKSIWQWTLAFLADLFGGWVARKKAAQSEVESREAEKIINEPPKEQVKTVSDWNKKAAPVLILLMLFMTGCGTTTVYVADRKPIIELPARPKLDGPEEFTPREQKLVNYATDLEGRIEKYDAWALEQNKKNGYADDPK